MFSVYVLKSKRNSKRYIGQSSKDAFSRLKEHNCNSNKWTKRNGPFELVYSEEFETRTEAIKREHFLKSGQGRQWLDIKFNIPG